MFWMYRLIRGYWRLWRRHVCPNCGSNQANACPCCENLELKYLPAREECWQRFRKLTRR